MEIKDLETASDEDIQACAREKVRDLRETSHFVHALQLTQLQQLLSQGVVSADFASRAHIINFTQNYGVSSAAGISITKTGLSPTNNGKGWPWPGEVYIVIEGGVALTSDEPIHYHGELLTKRRVPPRKFLGLGVRIGDIEERDFKIDQILGQSLPIWRSDPKKSLPIYDIKTGELLWPSQMGTSLTQQQTQGKQA